MARTDCRILILGEGMMTHITSEDVPDWVVEVIQQLATTEGLTLEQASRLLMYQGAVFYSERLERKKKGA